MGRALDLDHSRQKERERAILVTIRVRARVHLCLPKTSKDDSPQNGRCGPSASLGSILLCGQLCCPWQLAGIACLEHEEQALVHNPGCN